MDLVVLFATVPTVTAFVGWVTNWAAVKMIFYPSKFVGIGPLGWQGVLPRKASGFAQSVADTVTGKLISARELAERLDPGEVEVLFEETLNEQIADIVRESAEVIQPGAWDKLPDHVRAVIISQIRKETTSIARELFDRLQGISEEILDLRALIVSLLSGKNTDRLVRLFQEIGAKELKFIEYYGGVFGFLIGLLQVVAWTWCQNWWLMPIVGVVVGLVTNWLAIQMIFRPFEPRRYFGIVTYQGMFPKRQADIAADYGRITADEILTPGNLIRLVTEGEAGLRIARLVTETISAKVDEEWKKMEAFVKPVVPNEVGPEELDRVKAIVVLRIAETMPDVQPRIEAYLERKLDIARTVESKLGGLSKPEFERILRGIFEEDEIVLIVIGGVLGGLVGVLQGILVLATQGG